MVDGNKLDFFSFIFVGENTASLIDLLNGEDR